MARIQLVSLLGPAPPIFLSPFSGIPEGRSGGEPGKFLLPCPPFCCFASTPERGRQPLSLQPSVPSLHPLWPEQSIAVTAPLYLRLFASISPFCHLSFQFLSCSATVKSERGFRNAGSAQIECKGWAGPVGQTWTWWACSGRGPETTSSGGSEGQVH